MIKALAINGSPRPDGNTATLLRIVLAELDAEGVESELVQLGSGGLRGCAACFACYKRKDRKCAMEGDIVNGCVAKMLEADAIILGSPVYVGDISAGMRALIERVCVVSRANGGLFARKLGAGVVAVRRAGGTSSLDSINRFFSAQEMLIVGSSYWSLAFGREKGEVEQDGEGVQTMKALGRNMAWALKMLKA